jgi:hypothetical protein
MLTPEENFMFKKAHAKLGNPPLDQDTLQFMYERATSDLLRSACVKLIQQPSDANPAMLTEHASANKQRFVEAIK